jgi:hypothetical protein
MDVHRAVQKYIKDEKEEKKELTQSQKVVALVLDTKKVELWVDPSGPVAELVGIEGGVVSGVFNLESPDVEASGRRPRHEEH